MLDIQSSAVPLAFAETFAQLENAFRRVSHQVSGMTDHELHYRGPDGRINSTAALVAHMAYTDLEYLHRIKDEPISPHLESQFGPPPAEHGPLPTMTGYTAAQVLERYQRVLGMVRDYLQTQTDGDARRPVSVPWWPEPATVRYVLWHMAGHSMFHLGQIARLRAWYREQDHSVTPSQ